MESESISNAAVVSAGLFAAATAATLGAIYLRRFVSGAAEPGMACVVAGALLTPAAIFAYFWDGSLRLAVAGRPLRFLLYADMFFLAVAWVVEVYAVVTWAGFLLERPRLF